jgi:hypothetical protein
MSEQEDINELVSHIIQFTNSGPNRVRAELLPLTLNNALRTKFYQSLWRKNTDQISLDNISALPLVTKEAIRQSGTASQVRNGLICNEVFTMGTTGIPLVTVRGDWEQKFIQAFFEAHEHIEYGCQFKRVLKFNDPYHGYHIKIPTRCHCHYVGIYESGSFNHARATLQGVHSDRGVEDRCTLLIGGERFLRAFTVDTATRYSNGFESNLEGVISIGNYLTERWRSQIEKIWKAPVVDTFSLSEIFGGATQSLTCGWYHFSPYVIPEVISPQTLNPITEGIGILVLTSLYPFQEAQPLIRYVTGDLVKVTCSLSSRPGELAIKPLGRAEFGIPLPDSDEWLITPASLLEIIDKIPQVARKPIFRDSNQVRDPELIGAPIYRLSWGKNSEVIQIKILVILKKETASNIVLRVKQQIIQELRQRNELLAQCMDLGTVQLQVLFSDNPESIGNALDIWM